MSQEKKYFAIKKGAKTGVFFCFWDEAKEYVIGYKDAEYKSFLTKKEAIEYLEGKKEEVNKISFDFVAYTDGSFFKKDLLSFSCGGLLIYKNKVVHEISYKYECEKYARARNVAGEICGVVEILQYCIKNNISKILINVDYKGLIEWFNGSWKAKEKLPKLYVNYLNKIKNKIEIKFNKIAAHTNNYWNDRADELAKKGYEIKEMPQALFD